MKHLDIIHILFRIFIVIEIFN